MSEYNLRYIDEKIGKKLKSAGGILLKGARFCGKTTTAMHHAASIIRFDESEQIREQAALMPSVVLQGATPRLIDEWQLVPSIWNAARYEIDQRATKGQFILTGSASPSDDISAHTGAGRFARITLRTMSLSESGDSTQSVNLRDCFEKGKQIGGLGGATIKDYAQFIVRGGMPAIVNETTKIAHEAMLDYVENISFVDMQKLESPPTPERISALIRSLSRNISTEASLEKLAAETGITDSSQLVASTVRKYLDQLSDIFILEELSSWKTHIRSSVQQRVKPKWHFVDPSVATAALRILPKALLNDINAYGLFFESLAIRDLRIYADVLDGKVYHYRDSSGLEIDAIVELPDERWAAFEIKLGSTETIDEAAQNLQRLLTRLMPEKAAQCSSLNVIIAGNQSYTRKDGVNVISLGHLTVE
ncbi:ATPase AAA [Bacteroidia bacterium]|nr:ATPase AAA [Bacteroidia bacterium]GHT82421.1 ATPase AAA [Bacteroidia bacterium]